jgi:DNA replication protein DnaC
MSNINITENIANDIGIIGATVGAPSVFNVTDAASSNGRHGCNNDARASTQCNNLDSMSLPMLLKGLKLPVIGDLYEAYSQKAEVDGWGYTKYLSRLCENELEARNTKQIEAYLKQSNLPSGKSITNFEFSHLPSITKSRVNDLVLSSQWTKRAENVLIFGPSGVGKTHLAAALGHSLIEKQVRVLFTSTTKLVQSLQVCNRDCKLSAALAKLDKYEVIILDDIGYVKKDEAETYVLFELIASRYESGSLVITSNQAFSEWDNIFATNSMTVAAIDRLVHHARILEISTESYRRRHALQQQMQEVQLSEVQISPKAGEAVKTDTIDVVAKTLSNDLK